MYNVLEWNMIPPTASDTKVARVGKIVYRQYANAAHSVRIRNRQKLVSLVNNFHQRGTKVELQE